MAGDPHEAEPPARLVELAGDRCDVGPVEQRGDVDERQHAVRIRRGKLPARGSTVAEVHRFTPNRSAGGRSAGTVTRRGTTPVYAVFAASGLLIATWVSRIPAVRERLDATEPQLGVALLCIAVGSLIAMPTTGRLCDRFGARRVLVVAMAVCSTAFLLAVLAPSIPVLAATLLVGGATFGIWDVAMNASAHEVELQTGLPLMPKFHGAFSVGGLSGAGLGAVAAAAGLPVWVHVGAGAVAVVGIGLVMTPALPEPPRHHEPDPAQLPQGRTRRIPFRLVALGLLTACTTLGEGAAADWGGLFLHDERGASESAAAVGFAVFSGAMAIGRFGGTWTLSHITRVTALRGSGVIVSSALVMLLAANVLPLSLVAMAGWGLGVAIVFPAAMSAAAEHSARPAHGIAVVATIGYGGFLLGPPLIGFLAGQLGLGVALWVVAALGAVLFVLAPAASPARGARLPAQTRPDQYPPGSCFLGASPERR